MRRRLNRFRKSMILLCVSLFPLAVLAGLLQRKSAGPSSEDQARRFVALGDLPAALTSYDRAIANLETDISPEAHERRSKLWLERGLCNLNLGRASNALADLHRARQAMPEQHLHWIREGEALLQLEHFEEASAVFEEASERFPNRARALRYASGTSWFMYSKRTTREATEVLTSHALPGKQLELGVVLRTYATNSAAALPLGELQQRFITPPHDSTEKRRAFDLLDQARAQFVRADDLLSDFENSPNWDVRVGRLRAEMHYRTRRFDRLRLVAEVLLRTSPTSDLAKDLRVLLANAYQELGLTEESLHQWQELRRLHANQRQYQESVRAGEFAIEDMLRQNDGSAALQLMEQMRLPSLDNPMRHTYYGRARLLTGDRTAALEHCDRAAEILRETSYKFDRWFRSDEHAREVLTWLARSLRELNRIDAARDVATALVAAGPDDPTGYELRASLLRGTAGFEKSVVDDQWQVFRLKPRRSGDWAQFEADQAALLGQDLGRRELIAQKVRQVITRFATGMQERAEISGQLRQFLTQFKQSNRKDRNRYSQLEKAGSELSADFRNDPYLAIEVARELKVLGRREHAYLLLSALSADHPKVAHFKYFLAEQDIADGRLQTALSRFDELAELNPSDRETLFARWSLTAEQLPVADENALIEEQLALDPLGTGRWLVWLSAIEHGDPLPVELLRTAAADPQVDATLKGTAAVLLSIQSDFRSARELSANALSVDLGNPFGHLAEIITLCREERPDRVAAALAYVASQKALIDLWSIETLCTFARWLARLDALEVANALLAIGEAKDQRHVPLLAQRADVLLELRDVPAALGELDHLEGQRAPEAQMRRRTVAALFAAERLEDVALELRKLRTSATGESWFTVIEALASLAAGMSPSSVQIARDPRHSLDEDEIRFLTLGAVLTGVATNSSAPVPAPIVAKLAALNEVEAARDRTLEQWLSASAGQRDGDLQLAILRVLALRRIDSFPRLLRSSLEQVVLIAPTLGDFARALAADDFARGSLATGFERLCRHLEADPLDLQSLRSLLDKAPQLDAKSARFLKGRVVAEDDSPFGLLIEAWSSSTVDSEKFLAAKRAGAPPALTATLQALALERDLAQRALYVQEAGPFAAVVLQEELERQVKAFCGALEPLIHAAGSDPQFAMYLAQHARRMQDLGLPASPAVYAALFRILVERSDCDLELYADSAEILFAQPSLEPAMQLASALRRAVEAQGKAGDFPPAAARATRWLGETLLRLDQCEAALSLVDWARHRRAFEPEILVATAHVYESLGDTKGLQEARLRAFACGQVDGDGLLWWAEQLETKKPPATVLAFTRWAGSQSVVAADPALVARMAALDSRLAYLCGDFQRSSREYDRFARSVAPDLDAVTQRTLQEFAVGPKVSAVKMLEALAPKRSSNWYRELATKVEEERGARRPGRP